jgi:ATP-dependent RNA helicase RhlE
MSFKSLGLSPNIINTTRTLGYSAPFDIQSQAIPAILKGRDVMGIAPTGSGKTACFVMPILDVLQKQQIARSRKIQVLIIVPTRELAVQIDETCRAFSAPLMRDVRTLAVYGGVSTQVQMKALYGTEVLVATSGRLLELMGLKALDLSEVRHLVIDEADKLFQLGFEEEINQIIEVLPLRKQVVLFSATLNHKIEEMKARLNILPLIIDVKQNQVAAVSINQLAYLVSEEQKGPFLRYLIRTHSIERVLIFVSSQRTADNVVEKLKKNGIPAISIHGSKSQGTRMSHLDQFKKGDMQVLVATDLIGRGIHIDHLPFVINYDLPRSPLDYVHRIGRTGRVNETGTAISILTDNDLHHFKIIQKKMGKQVPIEDKKDTNLHGF